MMTEHSMGLAKFSEYAATSPSPFWTYSAEWPIASNKAGMIPCALLRLYFSYKQWSRLRYKEIVGVVIYSEGKSILSAE